MSAASSSSVTVPDTWPHLLHVGDADATGAVTAPSSALCERLRVSVAVVTGSNGGIGGATVSAFEAAGFTVHGVDLGDDFPPVEKLDALVCTHGISGRSLGDGPVDAC